MQPAWAWSMQRLDLQVCVCVCVCAGSFNAVDLADLEVASHFVKYAVASYAIVPVTEDPDKK